MLRLSELYPSVQGEGPRVGVPTQFVRFAGCNMRCPGWPCDTEHAINPSIWRHQSEKLDPMKLADRVEDIAHETGARNICFTGGEPFMQSEQDLQELVDIIDAIGGFTFEAFTNGSFIIPVWRHQYDLTLMMDWKLTGSGEAKTELDTRLQNALNHREGDGIKFVVKSIDDLNEAVGVAAMLERHNYKGQFWVGRVWDATLSDQEIVEYVLSLGLPWNLNVQIHKYIWPPDQRGV